MNNKFYAEISEWGKDCSPIDTSPQPFTEVAEWLESLGTHKRSVINYIVRLIDVSRINDLKHMEEIRRRVINVFHTRIPNSFFCSEYIFKEEN